MFLLDNNNYKKITYPIICTKIKKYPLFFGVVMFVGRSRRDTFPTGQRQGKEGYFPPDLPPPSEPTTTICFDQRKADKKVISGGLFLSSLLPSKKVGNLKNGLL